MSNNNYLGPYYHKKSKKIIYAWKVHWKFIKYTRIYTFKEHTPRFKTMGSLSVNEEIFNAHYIPYKKFINNKLLGGNNDKNTLLTINEEQKKDHKERG
jgi:hypothetical protein